MMKVIFLLIHIALAATLRKPANQEIETFLNISNLELGTYELKSGDDSCMQGDLQVIAVEKGFSVVLNGRAIVVGLGQENYSVKDRSCLSHFSASYEKNLIQGRHQEVCKKQTREYHTRIEVTAEGFVYTQSLTEKKKQIFAITCVLTKVKP